MNVFEVSSVLVAGPIWQMCAKPNFADISRVHIGKRSTMLKFSLIAAWEMYILTVPWEPQTANYMLVKNDFRFVSNHSRFSSLAITWKMFIHSSNQRTNNALSYASFYHAFIYFVTIMLKHSTRLPTDSMQTRIIKNLIKKEYADITVICKQRLLTPNAHEMV